MKIGVIAATDAELVEIVLRAEDSSPSVRSGFSVRAGRIFGHETVLLRSGVGKVQAALGAALLIDAFAVDLVINVGIAGGLTEDSQVGDVVVGETVGYHDVDLRAYGYDRGQIPDMPAVYPGNPEMVALASSASPPTGAAVRRGLIVTGDRFLRTPEEAEAVLDGFPHARAVEMESAGIAQTAYISGVPFLAVRSLSDIVIRAGKEAISASFIRKAIKNSSSVVLEMVQQLGESKI